MLKDTIAEPFEGGHLLENQTIVFVTDFDENTKLIGTNANNLYLQTAKELTFYQAYANKDNANLLITSAAIAGPNLFLGSNNSGVFIVKKPINKFG